MPKRAVRVVLGIAALASAASFEELTGERQRGKPFDPWSAEVDAIKEVLEPLPACGISGVVDAHGVYSPLNPDIDLCGELLATNCTVSYRPHVRCPASCPFVEPHPTFSCLFSCVEKESCGTGNVNRPLPNPYSYVCTHCGIKDCASCESPTVCRRCFEGFELRGDHSGCDFSLDLHWHLNEIVQWVGVALCLLIIFAIIWVRINGVHPHYKSNLESIFRARRNRHFCKPAQWSLSGEGATSNSWHLYSLAFDVHTQGVVGVGFALFFNGICFLILVALLCFGATYFAFYSSAASLMLDKIEKSANNQMLLQVASKPARRAPAQVISPLYMCDAADSVQILGSLHDFARSNAKIIGLLYVLLFVLSLAFAKGQQAFARWFRAKNPTMLDYSLVVDGLPDHEIDEKKLFDKIQAELQKACDAYGAVDRTEVTSWQNSKKTHETPAHMKVCSLGPVELCAVSICYDHSSAFDEDTDESKRLVQDMVWRLTDELEIDMSESMGGDSREYNTTTAPDIDDAHLLRESRERLLREDRKTVTDWFEGKRRIKSTGKAILVFKTLQDVQAVWKAWRKSKGDFLWYQDDDGQYRQLRIHTDRSEPPAIHWANIGQKELWKRMIILALKWFGLLILVLALVFYPFAVYIIRPYAKTGRWASGVKMTLAGQVLGLVNMVMSITLYQSAYSLYGLNKDRMDLFIFVLNTVLTMVNTVFNFQIAAAMSLFSNDIRAPVLDMLLSISSVVNLSTENQLAKNIYDMLMPGTFFMGFAMFLIGAGLVPYIVNSLFMKLIYVWRALPKPLLLIIKVFLPWPPNSMKRYPSRNAEKGLEPLEMGVAWDQSNFIVLPTLCFCMLFFVSPYVVKTFQAMICWTLFYYLFTRFVYLRFTKVTFFNSWKLAGLVWYAWGIPLSIVAVAWCLWLLRANILLPGASMFWRFAMLPVAFIGNFGLWTCCYLALLRPWRQATFRMPSVTHFTIEDMKEDKLYTYVNCNPIYALKCFHYFRDDKTNEFIPSRQKGHPIACGSIQSRVAYYEIGKEYLLMTPERAHLVCKGHRGIFEFETWLEELLRWPAYLWNKIFIQGDSDEENRLPLHDSMVARHLWSMRHHVRIKQPKEHQQAFCETSSEATSDDSSEAEGEDDDHAIKVPLSRSREVQGR
eukprot:TRINITY_DN49172_c0_g1_i1.p1 TRINITY_DN49172_c0_g1~~TRINITY_DN49172_c0_g1_i1.p1  ORF type:complete len:1148 (-),score=161.33 TRINITY_DN49172_c0_g1_i1:8-3451(-)